MSGACGAYRGEIGAQVLGLLNEAEEDALGRHLATCHGCAGELAQLRALPGILSRVPVARLTDEAPVLPDAFADRLIAGAIAAARRRQRRRGRWLLAAAAAALVVLAVLAVDLRPAPVPPTFSATNTSTGTSAKVQLQPLAAGTSIRMEISGVPPLVDCTILAVGRAGGEEVAGSWRASYSGTATVSARTAIPRASLAELVVETSTGERLVTIRFPSG